jgi:hypothetical protein
MSRSNYTEDYDDEFPGQFDLYRANVDRSIRSKAGQARLRELRDALLALRVKKLEAGIFIAGDEDNPRVCGLGAWALHHARGVAEASAIVPKYPADVAADDYDTADALKRFGWPKLVVWEAIYVNDLAWSRISSEERYQRVLAWVTKNISEPKAAA